MCFSKNLNHKEVKNETENKDTKKFKVYHIKKDNSVKKSITLKSHDLYCDVIRFLPQVSMTGKHKHIWKDHTKSSVLKEVVVYNCCRGLLEETTWQYKNTKKEEEKRKITF